MRPGWPAWTPPCRSIQAHQPTCHLAPAGAPSLARLETRRACGGSLTSSHISFPRFTRAHTHASPPAVHLFFACVCLSHPAPLARCCADAGQGRRRGAGRRRGPRCGVVGGDGDGGRQPAFIETVLSARVAAGQRPHPHARGRGRAQRRLRLCRWPAAVVVRAWQGRGPRGGGGGPEWRG